jgi:hypothetical protein
VHLCNKGKISIHQALMWYTWPMSRRNPTQPHALDVMLFIHSPRLLL